MRRSWLWLVALVPLGVLGACHAASEPPHVMMDFPRASLFDAPVPADDLMGTLAVPDPLSLVIVQQMNQLLDGETGFSTTGGVFFQTSEPIDPTTLPALADSVGSDSPAFLVGIDPNAPDYGVRYPVEVSFQPQGDHYTVPNLVTLLPLQGMPLRPSTRYAAVLTTAIHTADGEPLAAASSSAIARFPDAMSAIGIDAAHVAGITAFTTWDPTAQLATVRQAALARPLPVIDAAFTQTDVFDDYCVYHTTIPMPDWQSGDPPFTTTGGTWQFDGSGQPIFQRTDESDLVVTIPRTAAPTAGYPLVVFVRTGGGGDRPLVDRGAQACDTCAPTVAGEGPALYLARAGFAGIEVDGPLGGLRDPSGDNEDFLVFNVQNLGAMRDNIRESAVELDVIAHVGIALQIDTSDCTGASATSTFDASHVALMGHSMGSWIEPLAAAFEPLFGALVLSGAGGSYIENVLYKQQPTAPYPVIVALLHIDTLTSGHPVLSFAQWGLEPSDPQVYTRMLARESSAPRHELMIQGIVDDYILPRIANATSLSIGLDLAGTEVDTESDPRLAQQQPLGPLLPLDGHTSIALPAELNLQLPGGTITGVVTQHMEDGILDGHEVMFQEDAPKHEYQCFLASWLATGKPSVPTDDTRDAPCPPTD
ncbi:MAG TPA: hypothetical protein VGG74_32250 [Kofleriaceae bacterium]